MQDLTKFKSVKTGRGPFGADWKVQLDLVIRSLIIAVSDMFSISNRFE